jgi:hypothetical protein
MKKKAPKQPEAPAAPVVPPPPPPFMGSALPGQSRPDIYADRLSRLSPEMRARLRGMLLDPLYVHFLRIVAGFKPSSNVSKGGSGDRDEFSDARCNARLGEIRGWELYEAAIFLALNEPPEIKQQVAESFQPADADWNKPVTTAAGSTASN